MRLSGFFDRIVWFKLFVKLNGPEKSWAHSDFCVWHPSSAQSVWPVTIISAMIVDPDMSRLFLALWQWIFSVYEWQTTKYSEKSLQILSFEPNVQGSIDIGSSDWEERNMKVAGVSYLERVMGLLDPGRLTSGKSAQLSYNLAGFMSYNIISSSIWGCAFYPATSSFVLC